MSKYDDYEMTVGIECHVQLDTKTKLFSSSDNDARNAEANTKISQIDWGMPGMLPVLNKQAIVFATRAAKALGASVNKVSRFDRKHYFYPDLPKGYQTSQLYQPIIGAGVVHVESEDGDFDVRIEHAHLEEDAGKLTHGLENSYVDLNRAGTPLIEIVTMPDIHSAKQARAFASELHRLMVFAGVTKGDLYHGNMRFDVNISVAKKGSDTLGTRAEIKNLNSFRSVEKAADYEFYRQIDLLEKGEKVVQETRGFDEAKQRTFSQRSKEEAQDYRYMPDPDIPPVILTDEDIAQMQEGMSLLPPEYRAKWKNLNFDISVINTLLYTPKFAKTVSDVQDKAGDKHAKRVANWISSKITIDDDMDLERLNLDIDAFIKISQMVEENKLSSNNSDQIFNAVLNSADKIDVEKYAAENNLLQVSDDSAIEKMVEDILATEMGKKAIEDVKSGNMKATGFIVGQVMKLSKGQANPQIVNKIISEKIK